MMCSSLVSLDLSNLNFSSLQTMEGMFSECKNLISVDFSNLNENIPFSIRKIILFSSATADGKTVNHSVLNLNISQYCDIGIYLSNNDIENTQIDSLFINHIYVSSPELGTPYLYKKNVEEIKKMKKEYEKLMELVEKI